MNQSNFQALHLSQSNLQDFVDCPRRFELKVINGTDWPAAISDPPSQIGELIDQGIQFHQLAHQFFIGVDPELIAKSITNPQLLELWEGFLPFATDLLNQKYYTEQILRYPYLGHVLIGKFDYVAYPSDKNLLIIDWKTATRKPDREKLSSRIQTILYPFILTNSYKELFPDLLPPFQGIKIQYFYPLCTDPLEIFSFPPTSLEEIEKKLSNMIHEIEKYLISNDVFPLTSDLKQCTYCSYRSYCERGYQTLELDPLQEIAQEDLTNAYFDLNDIEEIEF